MLLSRHYTFLKITVMLLLAVWVIPRANAQCANNNSLFGTTAAPTTVGVPVTMGTCIFGGEYVRINGLVAGGTYEFSTCGDNDFDTQITIYPEAGGSSVAYNDDYCGLQSFISFTPAVSGDYRVLVDQFNCTSNSICMTMTVTATSLPVVGPSNDLCAGAIDISCEDVVTGSTSGANSQSGLPYCGTSFTSAPGVWYHFVGTGFDVEMSTCNPGSNYDTKLGVYTGSCGALTCLVGNDDSSCSFSGLRSTVNFNSVAGQDYYIYVTGFGSATGNFELSVSCPTFCPPPAANCKSATVTLDGNGVASLDVSEVNDNSTFNCGLASMNVSPNSFNCSSVGANTVTLTVVDINGGSDNCTATVTVVDDTPPTAQCKNATVYLDNMGGATITEGLINNGSWDACNIASMVLSPTSFNCSNVGMANVVTMVVTDNNGNVSSCTANVTVNDNSGPQITCPSLPTVNGCLATVPDLTIPIGTVLANSSADFSAMQGDNGWQYGRYLAFDSGNFTQLPNFTGFVWNNPGVGAILDFPQLDPNGGHPQFEGNAWAVRRWTSNFSGTVQLSGDFFDRDGNCGDGAHVRIFHNGVEVFQFFNIPLGSVPYSFNLNVDSGDLIDFVIDPKFDAACDDTHFTALITAVSGISHSDNCGVVNVTQDIAPGTVLGPGMHNIILTAYDAAGNNMSCTTVLNVVDGIAPVAVCNDLTVQLQLNMQASVTPLQMDGGSSDNCGIVNRQITAGQTNYDCSDLGQSFPVTLTVYDNAGNSNNCTGTVTVADMNNNCDQSPTAVCQNVTVNANANCEGNAVATQFDNGSSDPEGGMLSYSVSPSGPYSLGSTNVTLTVTDPGGNSDNCSATITVVDGTAPNITCPFDITVNVDPGACGATVNYDAPSATDNCGMGVLPTSLPGFTYIGLHNGHAYFLSNNQATPEVAHAQAIATGGHLVTINSAAENNFVSSFTSNRIWIGFTDRETEGDWQWVTGEPVTFENWAGGEPNNAGAGEDWAVINWSGSNPDWNDWFFTATAYFAVEFDGGTIPANLTSGLGVGGFFPVGTNTETWTATDDAGNSDVCSFNITVIDNIPPAISCPANITTNATSPTGAIVNYSTPAGTDNCTPTTIQTAGFASGANFPMGTTTNSFTVTDPAGSSASCSFTVTVSGLIPDIQCPSNISVFTDSGVCGADVSFAATDNTGVPPSMISYSHTPGSTFPVGTTTVTATATNSIGSDNCSFDITVTDNEGPNAICQNAVAQLNDMGNASITAADINNGSSDNCGIASLSVSPNSFSCGQEGADVPVTLTVTDVNGNSSTCTATVEVDDQIDPVANCMDITVYLDASGNATITEDDVENGSTDNCGWTNALSVIPNSFDCSNIGPNTVTAKVGDGNGNQNTCTGIVTIADNVGPVAICQTAVAQLDDMGNASITAAEINNGSYDVCGAITSMSVSPSTFSCGQEGADVPVTLTVTDEYGNSSTCTTTVEVDDQIDPVANCMDITVYLDASGNATITEDDVESGSTDNCGWTNALSVIPNSFDCSNIGPNTVTVKVGDGNGNQNTCTGIVTIADNVGPVAICQTAVAHLDDMGNASITAAEINNGSYDVCGAITSMSVSPSTFSCNQEGADVPVTLTVTDEYGNSSTCSTTVEVDDQIDPVANCMDITVYLDANGNATITEDDVESGSTDNCGWTNALSVMPSSFDCSNIGPNTVTVKVGDGNGNQNTCTGIVTIADNVGPVAICQTAVAQLDDMGNASITAAEINNGSYDVCGAITSMSVSPSTFSCNQEGADVPVTLTVTDEYGNSSTCTTTVEVDDQIDPVANCMDITVYLDANGNATITEDDVESGSTDNCGWTNALSVIPNSFDCSNIGPNTVTVKVGDGNGNQNTCTGIVTIADNTAPTAVCQNATVQLDANGAGSITVADIDGGSGDACGIDDLSISQSSFDCSDSGSNTVTLTVTDVNGQSSTCTATVTVVDNIPPTAICQDATVYLDANGIGGLGASVVGLQSYDNCGVTGASLSPSIFDCSNVGGNTVTLTVTDAGGLSSTCTATVTVVDNIPPTAVCQDATVYLDANGTGGLGASVVGLQSYDNCGLAGASLSPSTFDCSNVGGNTVTLTVTDVNGLSSTCTATVTVMDDVAPEVMCQPAMVELDEMGNASITAADIEKESSDACGIATLVASPNTFGCGDLGENMVTLTAIDENGNENTCQTTVLVEDNIAPEIDTPCPGAIVLCGPQNVNWTPPTATDNCGIVSTVSSHDPGDWFDVGTTTVTYTFYDEAGLSVSCEFDVVVNPLPNINISQTNLPPFCQGVKMLRVKVNNPAELTYPLTYEWSSNLGTSFTVVAPSNGTYEVTVTDALGCSSIATTIVDVDLSTLLSAYTIIGDEELEMEESLVESGGVGIFDGEEVEVADNSEINTFLRSEEADIDASSSVNQYVDADLNVTLPPFQSNPFNNYNNVVVPAGGTVTLTGNNYGYVSIQFGGTLIIENPEIYLRGISAKGNATIDFLQPTNVMVKKTVKLGNNSIVNPTGHSVVFYVGDDVSVKQGSNVTANIYAKEEIEVNDSGSQLTTYMTGMFISLDMISSADNTIWNWNLNCSSLPQTDGNNQQQTLSIDATDPMEELETNEVSRSLLVYPNPATDLVNLNVTDFVGQEVELYVYDGYGKLVLSQKLGTLEVPTISIDLKAAVFVNGIYQIQLKTGEEFVSTRFILSK